MTTSSEINAGDDNHVVAVEAAATLVRQKLDPATSLTQAIPFLEGRIDDVKMFFSDIPVAMNWNEQKQINLHFPNQKGYGNRQIPLCLVQDAQTEDDKLVVVNWWRFLSRAEQKDALEELRNIYAAPNYSNRLLPTDYFEKITNYKPPPTPKTHLKDDNLGFCLGWKGVGSSSKYDKLFIECYTAEFQKKRTMRNGHLPLESIPIPSSISKAKGVDKLHFVRRLDMKDGNDDGSYVLRSIECTHQRKEAGKSFCDKCSELASVVSHLVESSREDDSKKATANKKRKEDDRVQI